MLKGVLSSSIGSLPYTKAEPALEIAKRLDIPAWPQLPKKRFLRICMSSKALVCLGQDWMEKTYTLRQKI